MSRSHADALPPDAAERLPAALLATLASRGDNRTFAAHAILINEGDDTDSIYIVLGGRVKIYASSDEGREFVLAELGPGEYLGELSLSGEKRSVSVQALEPTRCCIVPSAELKQFLAENPEFAWHLTRKLMHMVRRLTGQATSLALQDVYGRVAHLLNEAAETQGGSRVVPHKLTHQDIADRVGSSREMVTRIMKALTSGGYMAVDGKHRLVILRKLPSAW